jgi:lysophospholipase L1-like esterase
MNNEHEAALSRRRLLRGAALAAGAAALPAATSAAGKVSLSKGATILFQGDSITDAGRDRERQDQPNQGGPLGRGYPLLLAGELLRDHAALELSIYNRGISGNKVPDLEARWKADCLDLKPALLSILVGVNDIWHKLNGRHDGTVDSYEKGFAALLKQTREALPATTLVICEPFVLRCGAVNEKWFPEFDQRRAAAARVAKAAGAHWAPFQSMFDKAVAAGTKPEYWAADGVHPSVAGHALMAKTWREVVGI